MRIVVQRVSFARVNVDGRTVGEIQRGLLVLLGITEGDGDAEVRFLADKCANLRIFTDENDKMNRSVRDIGGGVLIVSQFTLYGNAAHGRRPDFTAAARPETAKPLYEKFIRAVQAYELPVATGIFGASMQVELCNDGPVTIIIDSKTKPDEP